MITALIVFGFTVVMSALFSGLETGLISANPIRVGYLAREEGHHGAKRLLRVMEHLRHRVQMISTFLLGTNISTVAGTIIIAGAAEKAMGTWGDVISWLLITPIFLIFGEILPKSVFRIHPTRLCTQLIPVMEFFYIVLWPVAWPLTALTRKLTGVAGESGHVVSPLMSSLEDVRVLVDESADHGTIEREEQKMIHSVIDLQETTVKTIMVPRIDIQALPQTATRDELLDLFEKTGRTRVPVFAESIDEITGVVNVYDVMLDTGNGGGAIMGYVREVRHVPDTMKLDDLLADLKAAKSHLVIVTDEYGGTHGLITLEDILEEIFGEIQDEHDREESRIQRVSKNAYVIDARTPLDEVCEVTKMDLIDEEVDSVGGWLMRVAGRIPSQGEIIIHNQYRVTVLEGRASHVSKIRIDETHEAPPDHEA
jgi:CBS domain containing-hemolysin-like protein